MLAKLLLLFTVIPILELLLLIPVGRAIGWWPTIALIIVTGVIGVVLGKREGLRAWRRIREDLAAARIPHDSILDGLAVLLAGAFLITPGVLTDVAGLFLLIPFLRAPIKKLLKAQFTKIIASPNITFTSFTNFSARDETPFNPGFHRTEQEDIIDITPDSKHNPPIDRD